MGMPRLLIFSCDPSYSGLARLPKSIKAAGFEVAALCFPQSFLAKTRYLDQIFLLTKNSLTKTMNADKTLKQLVEVMTIWSPDLLIFGDESTVAFGHYLVQNSAKFKTLLPDPILQVIKSSLGDPEFFEATLFKNKTLEVAHSLGIRAPAAVSVTTSDATLEVAKKSGYPIVLKKEFGCSGVGVKVCSNQADLLEKLPDFLPHPTSPFKSQIRRFMKRDWFPEPKVLSVQQFIKGVTAMYPVVAIKGEVLAGFAAVKDLTVSATGPSSVIRFINHSEMQATAIALIKEFKFTGFASFDFILEEGTNHAYLLECNPRPVSILHLAALVGIDISEALFVRLQGQEWEPQFTVEKDLSIALFPQEWKRDSSSENLRQLHHDVPWDDPELLKAYIS